jgi:hypothetical protein
MIRKANRKHICSLCHQTIKINTKYIYKRITPWDHIDNESFFDYKAHESCDTMWMQRIGITVDYVLPLDKYEWDEYLND